jgi:hypothetical protein
MKNLLAQDLRFLFARLAFSVGRCFAATYAVFFGCLVFRLFVASAKVRLAGKGRKNIVRDKTPFLKKYKLGLKSAELCQNMGQRCKYIQHLFVSLTKNTYICTRLDTKNDADYSFLIITFSEYANRYH